MNNYFIISDAELTAKGFKDYLEDLEWFDDPTLGVKIQDVIEKINDQYNVEDFCGYPGGLRKLGKKAGILRKWSAKLYEDINAANAKKITSTELISAAMFSFNSKWFKKVDELFDERGIIFTPELTRFFDWYCAKFYDFEIIIRAKIGVLRPPLFKRFLTYVLHTPCLYFRFGFSFFLSFSLFLFSFLQWLK